MPTAVSTSPLAALGGFIVVARRKLRVAAATLALTFVVAFLLAEDIARWLSRPLLEAWGRRATHAGLGAPALHYGALLEPFWAYMSLAFSVALVVSSPILFFQLWRIVAPRIPVRYRRLGLPFAGMTGACFIGGVLFGYFLVLPMAYDFLLSYADENLSSMGSAVGDGLTIGLAPALFIEPYLSLTSRMLLAFGVIFELPVILTLLAWLGVVDYRGLWRFNRWAIIVAFVVAAVLTPGPDVVSQVLMALPLVALYNLSILIAFLIARRRAVAPAPQT
jgi:sec-independent protein translocase protein TatC